MTLESQSIQHLNQREQDLNSYIDGTHGDNELNDNPLINMGIHSKYYDIGNVSMMKNLFAKKHSEDQLISLHINIQSLSAKYEALKELIKTLHENEINVDFILFCETFLHKGNATLFQIEGYNFMCHNRANMKRGGVAMYVKDTLQYKPRPDL